MITINNLTIQYGAKQLFNNISCRVNNQDRIGLAGVNGTGKSTLLKILSGIKDSDKGCVIKSKEATCGYLPQEIESLKSEKTLYKEAESVFADLLNKQKELDKINIQLADPLIAAEKTKKLLQRQGTLQHDLDYSAFFNIRSSIEKVLAGIGFKQSDLNRNCNSLSGGWLMRLTLAKQLLASPSFLFLDEPTNHLDIESLTWLEDFLASYQGAIIIVSHDRMFLDNMTNTTWELSLGRLSVYKGNYSKYLVEKEQRLKIQRAAYTNQQAMIEQTKRFVDRFRAKSTKAKQVQSRIKQLEKIELIQIEETERNISFRFPPAASSGRSALEVNRLSKSYGTEPVFKKITFSLQRGDKLAIVGVNGAGKSTLVKILAGLLPHDSGSVNSGHNVTISYFGQHQAQELDPKRTVFDTISQINSEKTLTQLRSLLGAFLFKGDDVNKKVEVLSGGEKSRLALVKMIATPANLLIMDEPTNHLDMTSQEILQDALSQYDGTIIIVSHNRFFLDYFINKVLEIKNKKATLYEGNLAYYLSKITEAKKSPPGNPVLNSSLSKSKPANSKARGKKAKQKQANLRKEKSLLLKPYNSMIKKIETEIEKLESSKNKLETILADPDLYKSQDAFAKRSKEYADLDRKTTQLYEQWEKNHMKIEKIEADFIQT